MLDVDVFCFANALQEQEQSRSGLTLQKEKDTVLDVHDIVLYPNPGLDTEFKEERSCLNRAIY